MPSRRCEVKHKFVSFKRTAFSDEAFHAVELLISIKKN